MFNHTLRKMTSIAIAILVIGATVVGCRAVATQAGGGGQPEANRATVLGAGATSGDSTAYTIGVTGSGKASAKPDTAYIQLGVESIQTNAGQAVSDNTQRMTAVMEAIKGLGIAEEDVQTINYSMWSEQVSDRDGKPTGEIRYHVTNQVNVRLQDLAKTGELLEKALSAGANNVGGITFGVADPTALQRDARDQAIANAKAKAEQMAKALGVGLGKVHAVSEYGGLATPAPRFAAESLGVGGGGAVPVSSGQFEVVVEVQVTFDMAQ